MPPALLYVVTSRMTTETELSLDDLQVFRSEHSQVAGLHDDARLSSPVKHRLSPTVRRPSTPSGLLPAFPQLDIWEIWGAGVILMT